jgi:hypothetical protein
LRGGGRDVNADERVAVGTDMLSAPIETLLRLAYPTLLPLHDAAGEGLGGWRGRRLGFVLASRIPQHPSPKAGKTGETVKPWRHTDRQGRGTRADR